MKVAVFVLCVGVAALITPGKATIECYECTGSACKDPYEPDEGHVVKNCDYCGKTKISGSAVGEETSRVCWTGEPIYKGCKGASVGGQSADTCFCDTELCNSGSTITLALSALLSALAVKYLL